jgi:hypothetical protein
MSPIIIPRPSQPWGYVVPRGSKTYPGPSNRRRFEGALMDPDAAAYITAVETADSQALETAVRAAINDFVVGCKADGIWEAIKASCILAGARTRLGALTPLAGTAPASFNFVDSDYNRKTGLVGDGSAKYLDSNRNCQADPEASFHAAVFRTTSESRNVTRCIIGNVAGNVDQLTATTTQRIFRCRTSAGTATAINDTTTTAGLWGHSRNDTVSVYGRYAQTDYTFSVGTSVIPNSNHLVYRRSGDYADARLAFYSLGEFLNLALLDARVTNLLSTFASVIP